MYYLQLLYKFYLLTITYVSTTNNAPQNVTNYITKPVRENCKLKQLSGQTNTRCVSVSYKVNTSVTIQIPSAGEVGILISKQFWLSIFPSVHQKSVPEKLRALSHSGSSAHASSAFPLPLTVSALPQKAPQKAVHCSGLQVNLHQQGKSYIILSPLLTLNSHKHIGYRTSIVMLWA